MPLVHPQILRRSQSSVWQELGQLRSRSASGGPVQGFAVTPSCAGFGRLQGGADVLGTAGGPQEVARRSVRAGHGAGLGSRGISPDLTSRPALSLVRSLRQARRLGIWGSSTHRPLGRPSSEPGGNLSGLAVRAAKRVAIPRWETLFGTAPRQEPPVGSPPALSRGRRARRGRTTGRRRRRMRQLTDENFHLLLTDLLCELNKWLLTQDL